MNKGKKSNVVARKEIPKRNRKAIVSTVRRLCVQMLHELYIVKEQHNHHPTERRY